jgi:hypothetical protein
MKTLGWFLPGAISLLAIQALAVTVVLARAHGWSAREQMELSAKSRLHRMLPGALP